MNARSRLILVVGMVLYVITFHCIKPLLAENTTLNEPLHEDINSGGFKLDLSYESTKTKATASLVRVNNYEDTGRGSFFLKPHKTEEKSHSQYDIQSDHIAELPNSTQPEYWVSPILRTDVDIKITGLIARTTVTQSFTNPSEEWVDGVYVFPLPENAAVDHLTMQIGSRVIEGQILPKQQATKVYEHAKQSGRKATLLSQNRPNIFKNEVANIGPGETVDVTIEYQQAVHFENETFSLRFPSKITPRYLPPQYLDNLDIHTNEQGWALGTQSNNDRLTAEKTPDTYKHRFNLKAELKPGFPIASVDSEFHNIDNVIKSDDHYQITVVADNTDESGMMVLPNQDIVLTWRTMPNQVPNAAHFVERHNDAYYGMIMLTPPTQSISYSEDSIVKETLFIIDTSGSMEGASLEQAKQALLFAINQMSEHDTFNLVQFNSATQPLWRSPRSASPEHKRRASKFISSLRASGGTQVRPALEFALQTGDTKYEENCIRQVVFITDGAVGNEVELFSYIKQHLKQSRLFTVGIGAAPNSYFMTEAALSGRGTFTFIGSVDSVHDKMETLFTKLNQAAMTDLVLTNPDNQQLNSMRLDSSTEFYPKILPDLYKGEPIMISYKSTKPINALTLSGRLHNKNWIQHLSLNSASDSSGLNVLWARRKIAQLSRDKLLTQTSGHSVAALNQSILNTAMAHHLVSSMTSLVAVEKMPSNDLKNKANRSGSVSGNTQMASTRQGDLPRTTTSSKLLILIGLLCLLAGITGILFSYRFVGVSLAGIAG